ncbi:MAG: 8-amino-7-oxononanoate synthase [Pseudomonadales bacterium]|nr:8-amino-7-oxononanoate synthase [Pseudomonadales bacterium]
MSSNSPDFFGQLEQQLQQREDNHLMRKRHTLESPQGARVVVAGKSVLNFCSNDYLGLANHPKMIEAFTKAANTYGVGGGASHLVCGHTTEHHRLEELFAERTGRDRAVLFSTGFMANLGVITALLDKPDAVFEDKLNHASLLDGGLMSGAKFQRFLHNDMSSLQKRLDKTEARRKLICVDGVFSMDGDKAPLKELAAIAKNNHAVLMVDDAHGIGTLGKTGMGLCEEQGLTQDDVPILMVTLGKALGSFGSLVAGPDVLIDTLIQFARPYIYTTSMPPAVAAASSQGLLLLEEESWRRTHLQQLIDYFVAEASLIGLPLMPSSTAIQPLLLGDEKLALQWQKTLLDHGLWISAIRPPTVAKGTARLRITITAGHSTEDIDLLLDVLKKLNRSTDAGAL